MKTFAQINIVVHYPKTEDGWKDLRRRVASIRADMVLNSIAKLNCPTAQKQQLLEAIIQDVKSEINNEKAHNGNAAPL